MKSFKPRYALVAFELVLLSACTLPVTPSSTPTELAASPAPVSIDLAGPEMKVGSTFLYADGSLLVAIPAGMFTMGNGVLEGRPENPARQVNLSDFWIYRNKVTNQQYAYCVAMGGCTEPFGPDNPGFSDYLRANDPVVGVDYIQAAAYCGFVHARLPTEAEWEKTARGPDAYIYPWGDAAPSCDLLNYGICVGSTTPVNTYPMGQSYYTAFDMEGNALEWAADWYQADYYLEAPADNPQGPDKGRVRSVRSSAFNSGADQIPTFTRSFSSPDTHRNNLGFRCVVEDPTYFAPFCTYPATYGTDGIGGAVSGRQTAVSCPEFSIEQSQICRGREAYTHVKFIGGVTNFVHGQCLPVTMPDGTHSQTDYLCRYGGPGESPGRVQLCGACQVTLTSRPICPKGYAYDDPSKSCRADSGHTGTGTCLPGYALGTPISVAGSGQCCTYNPPNSESPPTAGNWVCEPKAGKSELAICHPSFPHCPTGTAFDGQECISTTIRNFCRTEVIVFHSCTPTGGSGCPDPGCDTNYIWNPTTCTCDCNGC